MKRPSSTKLRKRDSQNLKYKATIVKTVYHNPFCLLEFIRKAKGTPTHQNTLRKLVDELLETTFFEHVIYFGKECFFIDRFENPECYNFKTFYRLTELVFNLIESNDCLKKTKAYEKFINHLGVSSLLEIKKSSFSDIPLPHPRKFNIRGDYVEQILSKLFSLYYLKVKQYFREERYEQKGIKTLVPLNVVGRVNDITYTLVHFIQFLRQSGVTRIGPIHKEYVQDLAKMLYRDYEDTYIQYNKMAQYLTTKTSASKSKRTVRNSKQQIELLNFMVQYEKSNLVDWLRGINNLKTAIKDVTDDNLQIDFGKLIRRRAKEKATDVMFVDDYDIEELLWKDMKKNPIKIDPV